MDCSTEIVSSSYYTRYDGLTFIRYNHHNRNIYYIKNNMTEIILISTSEIYQNNIITIFLTRYWMEDFTKYSSIKKLFKKLFKIYFDNTIKKSFCSNLELLEIKINDSSIKKLNDVNDIKYISCVIEKFNSTELMDYVKYEVTSGKYCDICDNKLTYDEYNYLETHPHLKKISNYSNEVFFCSKHYCDCMPVNTPISHLTLCSSCNVKYVCKLCKNIDKNNDKNKSLCYYCQDKTLTL